MDILIFNYKSNVCIVFILKMVSCTNIKIQKQNILNNLNILAIDFKMKRSLKGETNKMFQQNELIADWFCQCCFIKYVSKQQ